MLTGAWTGVGFVLGDPAHAGSLMQAASQIASHRRGDWCLLNATGVAIEPLCASLYPQVRAEIDESFNAEHVVNVRVTGCVVRGSDGLAALAWAPVVEGLAEVGVAPAPAPSTGLAAHAAQRLIRGVLASDAMPHVSTNARNEPARRGARSMGFVGPVEHDWLIVRGG